MNLNLRMKRMFHLLALAVSILGSVAVHAASAWVDMGPVQGTAQGHVWAKVVDEAGNTTGRNERWDVKLPAPAAPEFIIKCPDPYALEAVITWQGEYGDYLEWKLERIAGGFYKKWSSPWDPKKSRNIRVSIASRHPPTDQKYQLIVNLHGVGNAVPRVSDAQTSPAAPASQAAVPLSNLALGKPATQSSTYAGTGVDQGARHAVDGKTGGRDPHDLTMTNIENSPWWQVDLGKVADIERVRLYNRRNPDVVTNKDIELLVSLDGSSWTKVYGHNGAAWATLDIKVNAKARFVRARLAGRGGLTLYEVEVLGR